MIVIALLIAALVVFALAALGVIAATAKVICIGLAFTLGAFVLERLGVVTQRRIP